MARQKEKKKGRKKWTMPGKHASKWLFRRDAVTPKLNYCIRVFVD
jgi:hypothetical protein